MDHVKRLARAVWLYGAALGKWLLLAAVTGEVCGFIGSAFHIGVGWATELREAYPWLLGCLPLAGLAIVAFYKHTCVMG